MSEKLLLPCPFCGCTKIPVQRGNGIGDVWLECTECEASTRLRENVQTCVKDWNRRTASPAALTVAARALERLAAVPGCGCDFPCRCGGAEWTRAELEGRMDIASEALGKIETMEGRALLAASPAKENGNG